MRAGIIDLGTNTFHLLIVEISGGQFKTIFHDSNPARIGKGGINRRLITLEASERAVEVLSYYRQQLDQFEVELKNVLAFGTSAIRNAENGEDFCKTILDKTGIRITVIDGNQEAEYIYKGVRHGVNIGSDVSLIMDIGGGSVEFIIGNESQIFWKQSFEIGGQRMMERFMKSDPISAAERRNLTNYFEENLIPLANAIHQYAPKNLIGSSGTFDSLVDIYYHYTTQSPPPAYQTDFHLPISEFYRAYALMVQQNHDERLLIPGMIPLRVDMIVVAVCLIDYIIKTYHIQTIQVSRFALKEGVLADLISNRL